MGVLYAVRYAHSASGSLCTQSFPSGRIIFFKNSLDFLITNLYLPTLLGVVWRGDAVMYSVFLQQCPKVRVVEV